MCQSNKTEKIDIHLLLELVETELGGISEIMGVLDARVHKDRVNIWKGLGHTVQKHEHFVN